MKLTAVLISAGIFWDAALAGSQGTSTTQTQTSTTATASSTLQASSDGVCYTYTFQGGDTCQKIATAYGLTVALIEKYNADTWEWPGCSSPDLSQGYFLCLGPGDPPMPVALPEATCGPQVPGTTRPGNYSDLSSLNPCKDDECCILGGYCATDVDNCISSECISNCESSSESTTTTKATSTTKKKTSETQTTSKDSTSKDQSTQSTYTTQSTRKAESITTKTTKTQKTETTSKSITKEADSTSEPQSTHKTQSASSYNTESMTSKSTTTQKTETTSKSTTKSMTTDSTSTEPMISVIPQTPSTAPSTPATTTSTSHTKTSEEPITALTPTSTTTFTTTTVTGKPVISTKLVTKIKPLTTLLTESITSVPMSTLTNTATWAMSIYDGFKCNGTHFVLHGNILANSKCLVLHGGLSEVISGTDASCEYYPTEDAAAEACDLGREFDPASWQFDGADCEVFSSTCVGSGTTVFTLTPTSTCQDLTWGDTPLWMTWGAVQCTITSS